MSRVKSINKLKLTLMICLMIVIEAIFCFTPLGTIPLGPIAATLSMIPVIITSITFGKVYGAVLGFSFALFSFIYWTFMMPAYPTAFIFTPFSEFTEYKGNAGSIIICFIPRILAGILPSLFNKKYGDIVASIIGSFTNTILVLLLIFVFFRNEYQSIMGKSILYVICISILTNGIPECIICSIVCPIIAKVLKNQVLCKIM